MGENLRFVYSIGGQLLAEFSGAGGTLLKEYIYGAQGLLATIEPTAVNPNGTRYTTADNLGSPRLVTNSTASLVSRHDYMPFGEELSAGVGGRTTVMGFPGSSDGLRQKFTAKERDVETGLDFFEARYYASTMGRFNSPDPRMASAHPSRPQSWNRYAYVLNNPVKLIDPNGCDAKDVNDEQEKKKQVVNPLDDKVINNRLAEIRKTATPLAAGETPTPTTVEQIQGEQTTLQNATIDLPEPDQDIEVANGYMRPVALVVLDQGGNIMVDPQLNVTEQTTPVSDDAKTLYKNDRAITSDNVPVYQQANGAFYDLHLRALDPNKRPYDIQSKQDLVIKSGRTNLFMMQGNQIGMNDVTKSNTFTQGKPRKFGN